MLTRLLYAEQSTASYWGGQRAGEEEGDGERSPQQGEMFFSRRQTLLQVTPCSLTAHLMLHTSDLMWKVNNWTKGHFFSLRTLRFSSIFTAICFLVTHLSPQKLCASCPLWNTFHGWKFKLNALIRDESSPFFSFFFLSFSHSQIRWLIHLALSSTLCLFHSLVRCHVRERGTIHCDSWWGWKKEEAGSNFARAEREEKKDWGKWLAYSLGNAKYKLTV